MTVIKCYATSCRNFGKDGNCGLTTVSIITFTTILKSEETGKEREVTTAECNSFWNVKTKEPQKKEE